MSIDVYEEDWVYIWIKSKNKTQVEVDAYEKLSNLQPASWYPKNKLVYIIEEKQLYRAKHTKIITYIGRHHERICSRRKDY